MRLILALLLAGAMAAHALAQSYPTRPIRIIVPYPPGGTLDAIFRPIGQTILESMGQPLILDNRPGGGTIIAMDLCAKAAADGYTICATSNDSMSVNPHLYSKLPYDTDRDFVGIANLIQLSGMFVARPSAPFQTLREMLAYAKSNPGKLNFASFGQGSSAHMMLAWINNVAGVDITHVPFKGTAAAVQALLSGDADVAQVGVGVFMGHIKAGKLKPLAVTHTRRTSLLPDVPTVAEQGIELPFRPWIGVVAPAATPRPVVNRLNAELTKAIGTPRFREEVLERQGWDAIGGTPEQFAAFLREDRQFGARLVKASGLKLD